MMASILAASFICLSVQGNTPEELLRFLIFGYRVPEPELAVMMNGGGILSMVKVSLIVCISSSFSCILEKTGILFGIKKKIGRLGERVTPYGGALLTSLPASMAACNQTLGIILTYQLCKDITDDKKELAIYLENSAVIVAPPVSYTHLDVYKRQVMNVPSENVTKEYRYKELSGILEIERLFLLEEMCIRDRGCLFTDVAHVESRIGRFYSYNGCNFPFQGCGSETEVSGHYFSYIGHLSPCSGRRNLLDRVLSDYGAAQTGRLYRI